MNFININKDSNDNIKDLKMFKKYVDIIIKKEIEIDDLKICLANTKDNLNNREMTIKGLIKRDSDNMVDIRDVKYKYEKVSDMLFNLHQSFQNIINIWNVCYETKDFEKFNTLFLEEINKYNKN